MTATRQTLFNPFPGLRPFEPDEDHLFFGRDGQSDDLLRRLQRTHFLAVVGTSGSGKSSLVRAGLLPGLYGGLMAKAGSRWRIALFRPGNDPIGNLAKALNTPGVLDLPGSDRDLSRVLIETSLRRGLVGLTEAVQEAKIPAGDNLLVVVDQFEELFRFKDTQPHPRRSDEAAAFVKLLLQASQQRELPIFVVLTMRSDYLGDCAQFRDLPEAINDGQYLIPRMTRQQRREAITGPVAVGGGTIAPRLVNRLLNDVGDNPDQLPIMQHALMRTWDRWQHDHQPGEPIDLRHYEASGGMDRALSEHADEAYHELPDARSQEIAEKLFKALTEKGPDNREGRRPATVRDICDITGASKAEVVHVIETFRQPGRTFLMPPSPEKLNLDTLIDISHESLIRNWQRLKEWVDEEAESARIYKRLADTALLHASGQAGLWRDPDLQIALDWYEQHDAGATWARRYHSGFDPAMEFLSASQEARDAERAAKEAARQRELQQAQALAEEQRLRAEAEREKAAEQERAAKRLRRRAVFLLLALVLAVIAAGLALMQTRIAESERRRAVAAEDSVRALNESLAEALESEKDARAFAEEQRQLAEKNFLEADSLRKIAETLRGIAEQRRLEALAARDSALYQAHIADSLRSKADSLYIIAEQNRAKAERLSYLATARYLALQALLQEDDALALRLARKAYELNKEFNGQLDDEVYHALQQVLNRPSFRDSGGPEVLREHRDWSSAVAFSADGRMLASAGADSSVLLWSEAAGDARRARTLGRHQAAVRTVRFSPDNRFLVSAGDDHILRLWSIDDPSAPPRLLRGHNNWIWSVAFSASGTWLASASADSTVIIWPLTGSATDTIVLRGHNGSVRSVAFSPDGRWLASGSTDETVRLQPFPVDRANPARIVRLGASVNGVAFSPDSKSLATASDDRLVRLWHVDNPEQGAQDFRGHRDVVNAVAFSPDGNYLASAGADQQVLIWHVERPRQPFLTFRLARWVWDIAFSPDGKYLAAASSEKSIKIWLTNPDLLADIARQLGGRELSQEEWQSVVGEEIPFKYEKPASGGSSK